MNFDQLEHIVAVSAAPSASQAASRLGISQPALSRSLKRLEAELGCELFDRTYNSMALNDAGALVARFAEGALRDRRRLTNDLAELSGGRRAVRIGAVAPAPLWRLTARIIAENPFVAIAPRIMTEDAVERALLNRDVDYGITLKPISLPGMCSEHIMDERLFAYVPKGHVLAGREAVSFADLDGLDFTVADGIGFWLGICRKNQPNSTISVMPDREVFRQVVESSNALVYTTDSPDASSSKNRVAVPLSDEDALARFYLVSVRGDREGQ